MGATLSQITFLSFFSVSDWCLNDLREFKCHASWVLTAVAQMCFSLYIQHRGIYKNLLNQFTF